MCAFHLGERRDDAVPALCGRALCGHVFMFLLGRPKSEITQPTSGCSWAVSREFYQVSQTPLTGGSSGPAPPLLGPWVFPVLHLPVSSGPARTVINAFCFKADTSQIITYRCSKTFMWGRRMRVRLSDSGATEDRKPQPGTRQSPGYTSLPDMREPM